MDIILFFLLFLIWLMVLFYHLEHPEKDWGIAAVFFFTFIFGAYFWVSGIQYQTGWSIVESGATTTATIVKTDLIAPENGWSYAGWLGIGVGVFGIVTRILFPLVLNMWNDRLKGFLGS